MITSCSIIGPFLYILFMAPWWGSHLESPEKGKLRAPARGQTGKKEKPMKGADTEKTKIFESPC